LLPDWRNPEHSDQFDLSSILHGRKDGFAKPQDYSGQKIQGREDSKMKIILAVLLILSSAITYAGPAWDKLTWEMSEPEAVSAYPNAQRVGKWLSIPDVAVAGIRLNVKAHFEEKTGKLETVSLVGEDRDIVSVDRLFNLFCTKYGRPQKDKRSEHGIIDASWKTADSTIEFGFTPATTNRKSALYITYSDPAKVSGI